MPCEQLVPIDRGLVMVSLLSGNPRENVAFGPARGHERPTVDNEGTQRSLPAAEPRSTIFFDLTLPRLVIGSTQYNEAESKLSERKISRNSSWRNT